MGVGAAIVGGSLISGYMGSKASDKASAASAGAAQASLEEQRRQFDLMREDTAPYREAGVNALRMYEEQLGRQATPLPEFQGGQRFQFDLQADPGYQFAREEALREANRAAAAQGAFGSGNRLAAISDRITGLASQYAQDAFNRQLAASNVNYGRDVGEYGLRYGRASDIYGRGQDYLNRLAGLAGAGQTATSQSAALGQSAAGNISNILAQNAAAQGAAASQKYGALNQAIQGGAQNYMLYNYLNKAPAQQTSSYGPYASGYRWGQ